MMFKKFDFKGGKVTFDGFRISSKKPLKKQILELKEDLLQIQYKNYVIDLGWRPMLNPKGSFILHVIKNYNWENPISLIKCKSIHRLKKYLENAVLLVQKLEALDENDNELN